MNQSVASTQDAASPARSLFGFYGPMNKAERAVFWGCAAGWAMDGMDFMLYPLVIGTITQMWNVSGTAAGSAVTVTLICSAVGGWLAGYLADRIGRLTTLRITILWFSFFSVVCAFAENFPQLIAARALLGFGFGGEWTAGAVLIGETVRSEYRGRAVGAVQAGYSVGWGMAVGLQVLFFSLFPASQAWRYMFAVGGVPALLTFTILRGAKEPALAVKERNRQVADGYRPSLWEIFGSRWKTTVLASLMLTGAQGGYYAMTTWLPRYLTTERHMSTVGSSAYLATLILGAFVGFMACAWLADIIGRRRLFIAFSIGAIITVVTYLQAPIPDAVTGILGFPLGFFSSGFFAALGPFLSEIFPTRLRGSGQGFCYNFGRGVGAFFPAIVGGLSTVTSLANAITALAVFAYALFLVTSLAFPETAGNDLE